MKKITPLSQQPPLKIESLWPPPPPFWKFGWRFKPPPPSSKKGRGECTLWKGKTFSPAYKFFCDETLSALKVHLI